MDNLYVGTTSIIFMVITMVIAFILPIGIMLYFRKKKKADIAPFFIGCIVFIIFALVLESTFHRFILSSTGSLGESIQKNVWLLALYGGLAAGLFEETGRLLAFKFLLKSKLSSQNALMYGAGHGGVEAVILVGITYVNNLIISMAINSGTIEAMLGETFPSVKDSLVTLATTPSINFLYGGMERVLAIALHIMLSYFVYLSVAKGRKSMFGIAILLHTLVNFVAVIGSNYLPIFAVELVFFIMLVFIGMWCKKLYRENEVTDSVLEE